MIKQIGIFVMTFFPLLRNLSLFLVLLLSFVLCAIPLCAAEKPALNLTETKLATIPEDYQIGLPVFSPDGSRVAYVAVKGAERFVVINGKKGKAFDWARTLFFSLDGKKVAYLAGRKGKSFIGVDDREIAAYGNACRPVFSPDGRKVAYEVKGGDEEVGEDKEFVVVGNKKGPAYNEVRRLGFSPDNRYFVYAARKGDKWFVVVDDKEGPAYDAVEGLVFGGSDGLQVMYRARKEGKQFIVIGSEERPADEVEIPAPSPEVSPIAYRIAKEGKWYVVIAGKESEAYDYVSPLVFSQDGKFVGYGVKIGQELWWKVKIVE